MFGKVEPINLSNLHNERIQLRWIERSDKEQLWSILSDHQAFHSVAIYKDHTYYQSRKILDQILSRDVEHNLHFGICLGKEGGLIGFISLQSWGKVQSMATLGYMLDRLYWGQGLATEAVGLLLDFGFTELGLKRVEGRCLEDNIASEKVLIKNGFTWDRVHPKRYGSQDDLTSKINIFSLNATCYRQYRER
ncbi:GNAT family N-acetyltransferase [Paenibacillus sp. FA6]|uniref:GNAT family N-acetyltransferase n=1 Tax=Paenibacillus sp. FA6 TaxID=3413029 RepID=UPI003F658359